MGKLKVVKFNELVDKVKSGELDNFVIEGVDETASSAILRLNDVEEAETELVEADVLDTKICMTCKYFSVDKVDEKEGKVGGNCSLKEWATNGLNTCKGWESK